MRYRFRRDRRRLDRKVTFFVQGGTENEFNEVVEGWAPSFSTRCAVYPAPGSEKYANKTNASEAPVLIEVRAEERTKAITPAYRAEIDGKTYELVSQEQPERGANIIIAAVYHNGA